MIESIWTKDRGENAKHNIRLVYCAWLFQVWNAATGVRYLKKSFCISQSLSVHLLFNFKVSSVLSKYNIKDTKNCHIQVIFL